MLPLVLLVSLAGISFLGIRLRHLRQTSEVLVLENRELRRQTQIDALTGLGTRRSFFRALCDETTWRNEGSGLLIVVEIKGLREYNERFGDGAGDGLLARIGHKLEEMSGSGLAFRISGDEFCLLIGADHHLSPPRIAGVIKALTEEEDVSIRCSYSAVWIPCEAVNAGDAFRIADRQLAARKGVRQPLEEDPDERPLNWEHADREQKLLVGGIGFDSPTGSAGWGETT